MSENPSNGEGDRESEKRLVNGNYITRKSYSREKILICILISVLVLIFSNPIMISAQDNISNGSSSIVRELREIKALLERESSPFSWSNTSNFLLTSFSIVATVSVAYFIFRQEQKTRRNSIIRRAGKALERELRQAIESIETGDRKFGFHYDVSSDPPIIRYYDYNSAVIITDSYESILHSAFFTEFHTDTQDILSNLYDRIRTHNRLVLSIGQFEKPVPKMFEYQAYLTEREEEIKTLLYKSQERVRSELAALAPYPGLKKVFRLKGNPDSSVLSHKGSS